MSKYDNLFTLARELLRTVEEIKSAVADRHLSWGVGPTALSTREMKMTEYRGDRLAKQHAELCKVFANPKRLRILDTLRDGELSVTEISEQTDIPQPTVSQHLRKMRDRGVVKSRDIGVNSYYGVTDSRIIEGMSIMRDVLLDQLNETELERKS